jgi:uncharacterized protein (DUF58 family)
MPGVHRASQRGTTGEFTEYRSYRHGDDPRRIDWRLLARSDRAFVRVTDERAWLPTWLVVDASASMAFPDAASRADERCGADAAPTKWTVVCQLAISLAAVANASGDPVGVLVNTRPDTTRLAPLTRRGVVERIAQTLHTIDPRANAGTVPTAVLLRTLSARVRVVIVTDLLDDAEALVSACAHRVAAGSAVTVVHVVHPQELTPLPGVWRALDPDHPDVSRTFTPASSAAYQRDFDTWRLQMAERVRAAGAEYVSVICGDDIAHAVRRVVGS